MEALIAKILALVISALIAYVMNYLHVKAKDNENALLAVSMLDKRVNAISKELEASLEEKLADGILSKKEKLELKKEAIELAEKHAKELGLDALSQFAPKLFPSLVDKIMGNVLSKAKSKLLRL